MGFEPAASCSFQLASQSVGAEARGAGDGELSPAQFRGSSAGVLGKTAAPALRTVKSAVGEIGPEQQRVTA